MQIACQQCGAALPVDTHVCPQCNTPLSATMRVVGKTIGGKYEILSLLGEGGMGAVYKARHKDVHRTVAIKLLHPQFSQNGEMLTRFEREARATGEIGHDNIIEIYDLGTDADTGSAYLVMEMLKGHELSDVLSKYGRMGIGETIDVMVQTLSALASSHELGIIHRDLKPDNIYLTEVAGRTNWVKILDFGIAKFQTPEDGHKLTQTGQMMGTPYYMAPEQIQGDPQMDHRLDIYACGVILYEMLTGRVPFEAPNIPAMVLAILQDTPPTPHELDPNIPIELSDVVVKAMTRDKNLRYQSAAELAQAIAPFGTGTVSVTQQLQHSEELARTALGRLGTDWNMTPPPMNDSQIRGETATGMEWTQTGNAVAPPKRGLGAAVAIVVVLVLAGGLGAGYFFGLKPYFDAKNAPTVPATQPPVQGTTPSEAAVPAVEAPPGAEMIKIRLSVEPAEAAIYLDGAKLPANPYVGSFVKSDGSHLVEAKADGHDDYLEWVKFDSDVERTLTLTTGKKGGKKKTSGGYESYTPPTGPVTAPDPTKKPDPGTTPVKTFEITKTPPPPPPEETKPEPKPDPKPDKTKKGIIEESPYG
jgi:serine/threonine-protein kinase